METLEPRWVLSANVGFAVATISSAASQMVVADFHLAVSDSTTSVPCEKGIKTTVELPTTDVRMPASNLPEGSIQRSDRPFPPLNTVTEETVRMPESNIPEGTIQRSDRPFPPLTENAAPTLPTTVSQDAIDPFELTVLPLRGAAQVSLKEGVAPVLGPRLMPRAQVVLPELSQLKNLRIPIVLHPTNVDSAAALHVKTSTTVQVEVTTQIERAAALANSGRKIGSDPPAQSIRAAAAFDNAFAELAGRSLKLPGWRGMSAF
jgi:hypothetical protein